MRKYTIPKAAYILVALILVCLSIGSTYAYFSAFATAQGNARLGKLDIVWLNGNGGGELQEYYDDPATDDNEAAAIILPSALELTRGKYIEIKENVEDETGIRLEISNSNGTVGAYCRLKITATYTPQNSEEEIPCNYDWIKLALKDANTGDKVFITDFASNRWTYNSDDGYYYYGRKVKNDQNEDVWQLTELGAGGGRVIADHIYLSENASANILGATIKIVLTLEGIQTSNNAYQSEWGLA